MPLVVPGINSSMGDKTEWANKLIGKKLTESTSDSNSFSKRDLPETHRIVRPGEMTTADHNPKRLNIHLSEDNTVRDVNFG